MRLQIGIMVGAIVCATVVALVAVEDHKRTRTRIHRAQEFSWYCEHQGVLCDRGKPGPIHEAWETREYLYTAAEGSLALVFVVGGVSAFRSVRRR